MALPAMMTRLAAVNLILRTINEAAVDALDPPYSDDVAAALQVLDEVQVEVLSRGYSFNVESDQDITLDVDGKYALPSDTIRVVLDTPRADVELVPRLDGSTLRLYNKAKNKHTFVLPEGLKATFVRLVDFDGMPEPARRYVAIRAARTFQVRLQGVQAASYSDRDELIARAQLRKYEVAVEPRSALGNWSAARILRRGFGYPRLWE